MTYEEAIEATVSRNDVLRELRRHYMTAEEIDQFFADCGDKAEYCGADVLGWLGY